jgi:hypothetical protein
MKIIGLEAENLKRLTAVAIAPKGSVVEIAGKFGVIIRDGSVASVSEAAE